MSAMSLWQPIHVSRAVSSGGQFEQQEIETQVPNTSFMVGRYPGCLSYMQSTMLELVKPRFIGVVSQLQQDVPEAFGPWEKPSCPARGLPAQGTCNLEPRRLGQLGVAYKARNL